jgi:PAS domain S-box-containing protein
MATQKKILDESEQRYNRLLRFLTDYIYTVKIENNKVVDTYHGPGCVTVTGYTSEDYLADPDLWYRMVHEEDKAAVLEQANKSLAGTETKPLEHRIIHRNGTLRYVRNSIVLSKDQKGKILYYDGLINDITERKKAEQSAAIKQQQLIQADKMVALGTMVTGIAHEISNPNNFILLNARFLQKVWDDLHPVLKEFIEQNKDFVIAGFPVVKTEEKIPQSLNGLVEGALRIQKITKNLTNFARKDAGELDHTVDINSIVESAILLTGNIIKNSTNNFFVNYNKELPHVKGNPQQLEQVIINLINNACQSLENKNQKISVDLGLHDDGKSIVVRIVDGGAGIERENLKYIFDPFYTTKRNTGGTGLGLYITYNIVKSHGGQLMISSEKGHGTVCEIILPIN